METEFKFNSLSTRTVEAKYILILVCRVDGDIIKI